MRCRCKCRCKCKCKCKREGRKRYVASDLDSEDRGKIGSRDGGKQAQPEILGKSEASERKIRVRRLVTAAFDLQRPGLGQVRSSSPLARIDRTREGGRKGHEKGEGEEARYDMDCEMLAEGMCKR